MSGSTILSRWVKKKKGKEKKGKEKKGEKKKGEKNASQYHVRVMYTPLYPTVR